MTINATEEIAYARELILSLWKTREKESEMPGVIDLIVKYTWCEDAKLIDTIEFNISKLTTALNQIKAANPNQ